MLIFFPTTLHRACFGSASRVAVCLTKGLHGAVHVQRPRIIKMICPGIRAPDFAEYFLNDGDGCLFHFPEESGGKVFFCTHEVVFCDDFWFA